MHTPPKTKEKRKVVLLVVKVRASRSVGKVDHLTMVVLEMGW